MAGNQTNQPERRGGKREGAGRRGIVRSYLNSEQFCKARGISPLFAQEVLAQVVDERRAWQRIFKSEDDRIVLEALKFLVSMRDGRPAQRINVTSTNINLSASDMQRARDIVRELRAESVLDSRDATPLTLDSGHQPDKGLPQCTPDSRHDTPEPGRSSPSLGDSSTTTTNESIMLGGAEGSRNGGR